MSSDRSLFARSKSFGPYRFNARGKLFESGQAVVDPGICIVRFINGARAVGRGGRKLYRKGLQAHPPVRHKQRPSQDPYILPHSYQDGFSYDRASENLCRACFKATLATFPVVHLPRTCAEGCNGVRPRVPDGKLLHCRKRLSYRRTLSNYIGGMRYVVMAVTGKQRCRSFPFLSFRC